MKNKKRSKSIIVQQKVPRKKLFNKRMSLNSSSTNGAVFLFEGVRGIERKRALLYDHECQMSLTQVHYACFDERGRVMKKACTVHHSKEGFERLYDKIRKGK